MGEKPHFAGHRVADISFRRGWIECDCGEQFQVAIVPDLPIAIGHAALAAVFLEHRRAEAAKAEATIAHYKAGGS